MYYKLLLISEDGIHVVKGSKNKWNREEAIAEMDLENDNAEYPWVFIITNIDTLISNEFVIDTPFGMEHYKGSSVKKLIEDFNSK